MGDRLTNSLYDAEQKTETSKALDLLDALTRSGELLLSDCQVHVVLASTQCFDQTLMETIIEKNKNPIEQVERSTLIMASVIHGTQVDMLVKEDQLGRVKEFSPSLF